MLVQLYGFTSFRTTFGVCDKIIIGILTNLLFAAENDATISVAICFNLIDTNRVYTQPTSYGIIRETTNQPDAPSEDLASTSNGKYFHAHP